MAVDMVDKTIQVPEKSDKVATALVKLYSDLKAAKASGATGAALVTQDVMAAIMDLGSVIGDLGGVGAEAGEKPIGVAKAFALAGLELAESETGK